ncbi:C25 family cysteine peptidase [bacterium]
MNKRLLNFGIALILNVSLFAGVVEKTYFFDTYHIEKKGGYQTIGFSNSLLSGKTGEPLLPYRAVTLLLPPGEAAILIEVSVEDPTEISGVFKLCPGQPNRPVSEQKGGEFYINKTVYQMDSSYPQSSYGEWRTSYMNGYALMMTTITPLKYNPVRGKITFFRKMTVRVYTEPDEGSTNALKNVSASDFASALIEKTVQNPDLLSLYPQKVRASDDYQLLIVTPAVFETGYQALMDFYLVRGLKSNLVTIETVESSMSGSDLQEKIRNYIIQEYQNHNIEYVLLGGDIEHVPYRGFTCSVLSGGQTYLDNTIPSDLYYSALDGTWNDDDDWLWGEIGEDDLLPEVSVARLPVSSTNQLENLISKIMTYKDAPVLGELRNPLLLGEMFWNDPLSWGADYLDLLIGHHEDNGYTTDGIPEDHDYETLYERDHGDWTPSTLLSKINEGKSFIYHSGHANYSYNMKLHDYDMTDANFSQVNGVDHNYTLVSSHGCNSGGFDQNDCIGEMMVNLENFAVAFVGNSRSGWDNEGQTEGPSTHLQREFVDALYESLTGRIGQAHLESRIDTAPWVNAPGQWEEGALRWCFYCCNVLGDPAMSIWTDEPVDVQADFTVQNKTNSTSLNVTLQCNGDSPEGLTCALIKDDVLHGVGIADASGVVEVIFDTPVEETGDAELVVSGYNCLPTHFAVLFTAVDVVNNGVPVTTQLMGNYPNPFNPATNIQYSLARDCHVEIAIFSLAGRHVTTLVNEKQESGAHHLIWDGKDSSGSSVGSGIYLCRLRTDSFSDFRKMTLVK